MKKFILPLLGLLGFMLFSSHELFLKTDHYFLSPGQSVELFLLNGTFDQSENAITPDRIIDAQVIGPDLKDQWGMNDFRIQDNITLFKFQPIAEGTYLAGISTAPRILEMDAQAFNDYLEHEGLVDTLADREKEGSMTTDAAEKYSKHVKALVQVGDGLSEQYATVMGYPIEFVPVTNPYAAKVGQQVGFQLLVNGKPLANHVVHYSTSKPGEDAHENESSTRTDGQGVVKFIPNQKGKWYVATIHMKKSEEENVDYESNWATFTFGVR